MLRSIACFTVTALLGVSALAQEPMAKFEVASVRATKVAGWVPASELPRLADRVTEGRADLAQPLRTILLRALRVRDHQLVAPDWTKELIVDIRATIPPGATPQQVPEMLRGLLVERFGLVAHTEARTMDAYQLIVGATGIKMREVEGINELEKEFEAVLTSSGIPADRVTQTADGPVRTISIPRGSRRVTSRTMYETTIDGATATKTINAIRMTMAELVAILTLNLDEPVVDRTGLSGIYQFRIELPRDEITNRVIRSLGLGADTTSGVASTFKAVETLGLKLERRRTPVDVVVIDSLLQHPTEN